MISLGSLDSYRILTLTHDFSEGDRVVCNFDRGGCEVAVEWKDKFQLHQLV